MYSGELLQARQTTERIRLIKLRRRTLVDDIPHINPNFEIITIEGNPIRRVAINTSLPLVEVPASQIDDPELLERYYAQQLGTLPGFQATLPSSEIYEQLLQRIELRRPGFLAEAFLYDRKNLRGVSGFRWIVTGSDRLTLSDPHERKISYAAVLASHNGKDFSRGYRLIRGSIGEVGIIPVITSE